MKLVDIIYKTANSGEVVMGRGGTTTLFFTGKKVGTDTIKLTNCPPRDGGCNETNSKPDIEIVVRVR